MSDPAEVPTLAVDDMDEQGIFYDVPFADYLAWPVLSKSRIDMLRELTPMHFRYALDHDDDMDTKALSDGRAFHAALLEPEVFESTYIVAPPPPDGEKWDRRKKAHKEAWAEFEGRTESKVILTVDERNMYRGMADAVHSHPLAGKLIEACEPEISIRWRDVHTGVMLKGRLDGWIPDRGNILLDAKSAMCAAPRAFGKASAKYGYYLQMAMYFDGIRQLTEKPPRNPILIACEKTPPYAVACYSVGNDELEIGRQEYKVLLMDIKACEDGDVWPGYDEGLMDLILPDWIGHGIQSYTSPLIEVTQ